MKTKYRVFISHGGDDTYMVRHLLLPKVQSAGADAFLDCGAIQYGEDFRETILNELGACDELLVILTKSSILRPWVLAEIGATLIRGKRVIAVRYGPSESELQSLGVLSLLGTNSLLHLSDFDEYVSQLTSRVEEVNYA